MANVLFLVGSLRKGSYNHQMAEEAEKLLAGKVNVTYLDYSQVPVFNQDLETPVLPAVAAARQSVSEADAIWIFSPVYNHAIPSPVKNILDWLSRSLDLSNPRGESSLHEKLVTVSSVAHSGHELIFSAYRDLLPFIRTQVVGEFTAATINPEAHATGQLTLSAESAASLAKQAEALLAAIQ